MTYRGHVKGGQIILEEPVGLPEGTEVAVEVTEKQGRTILDQFRDIVGVIDDLPEDFSENHDFYIHGTPKK